MLHPALNTLFVNVSLLSHQTEVRLLKNAYLFCRILLLRGCSHCPLMFLVSQVMFRKTGYIYGKVYITGWHFMDFPMPQLEDYELMVRGRYEGGDGPVRKISILGKTKTI